MFNNQLMSLDEVVYTLGRDTYFTRTRRYDGQLGAIFGDEGTEFRLWAPTASQVELLIYDGYYGPVKAAHTMKRQHGEGVFTYSLEGDCHGLTYRYRLTFMNNHIHYSNDPYARAVTVNGQRAVVVDLSRTNPPDWSVNRMASWTNWSLTVIYELHLRDFTMASTSGVHKKGKYLGAIEEDTRNPLGDPTGLSYLKHLGVTHVEFLPLFDYQSVDETQEEAYDYNWGYDPQNYSVPEGSYATDAYDPIRRIMEMKQLIQGMHKAGLRVIMDVVYNHVYKVERHSFHLTVPGYYFRYNAYGKLADGTGVGNDTASERYMMRKFIVESVVYWAKEYRIDGFRFDLMGIHDVETMNAVRKALDEIDPGILLFGEGWELNTPLDGQVKASHQNAFQMPRVGQFNDGLREAIKGNDFDATSRGFINGAWYKEPQLANNFLAGLEESTFLSPQQVVQYVEAHDNYTLYDRLKATDPQLDDYVRAKQHELASAIVLLAQGIPFIHAGQEFLRTKYGVRDSYNKPDAINQLDWLRQRSYRDSVEWVKKLIQLRKDEPLLRLSTYDEIRRRSQIDRQDYQIVQVTLYGEGYKLIIVFNGQANYLTVPLTKGTYIKKVYNRRVYLDDDEKTEEIDEMIMDSYTAMVLKQYN